MTYCGAAPGEIIYQMNFIYPSGVPVEICAVPAVITVNGNSGTIQTYPPQECHGP